MRADCELLERDVFCRFVNAALECVERLDGADFCTQESKYNDATLRFESKW